MSGPSKMTPPRVAMAVFLVFLTSSSMEAQPGSTSIPLSFTAVQLASGESEYRTSCVDCHGSHLDDGEFGGPPLKGPAFTAKWFKLKPNALVGYIQSAMPPDTPGRLPLGTYVEIAAYLLNANGIPPADKEMPANLSALGMLHYPLQKSGP